MYWLIDRLEFGIFTTKKRRVGHWHKGVGVSSSTN
jgi:hypothetical protein